MKSRTYSHVDVNGNQHGLVEEDRPGFHDNRLRSRAQGDGDSFKRSMPPVVSRFLAQPLCFANQDRRSERLFDGKDRQHGHDATADRQHPEDPTPGCPRDMNESRDDGP